MPTLNEILRGLLNLFDREACGEITTAEADEAAALAEVDLLDKLNAYAHAVKRLEAEAQECKAVASTWTRRADRKKKRAEYLRGRMAETMSQLGLPKIEADYTVSLVPDSKEQKIVLTAGMTAEVVHEKHPTLVHVETVPAHDVYTIDRDQLLARLADGEVIEVGGVQIGALEPKTKAHVVIR